jgi:putative nucleotidyltransferase with HDIG domain
MFRLIRKVQPRLSQWTGRRHSSRSEATVLPRFWRRTVLMRLAAVLATTAVVTTLVYLWGPPFPYRLGEICPYDLRVRVDFDVINSVALLNQVGMEKPAAKPRSSIRPEPALVERVQAADRPVVEKYPRGMVLLPRGVPVMGRQMALLHREHEAYQESLESSDHIKRGSALFLIFSLLAALVLLYVARFQTGLAQSLPTIAGICALVLTTLTLSMFLSRPPWHAVFIPLSMTAMILTLAYNPQFALLMSLSLALSVTVALGGSLGYLLELMAGLAPAVLLLRTVHTRTQLIKVATASALAYAVMTLATGLLSGQTYAFIAGQAFRHFLWGALAGFVLTGLLPLVERAFGIVTDISLLELADGSHPLLQELVRRAPGTYTHSITVGTLAEAAAETIGANPLLTRVGSYFHDVGKMLKPHYFIENQAGENLHDSLEPALSTLVILGHVKDGLALGKQYKLPRPILDFIAQHHGTTLVEYFYREAMRAQEDKGMEPAELEASFRYPGPKPQTRETGILMLADALESTSRTLDNLIPGSIRKLVHDLVMKRLLDGQFEESGLTLTELHRIEESLCKSLIALFHARIKYPDALPQEKAS